MKHLIYSLSILKVSRWDGIILPKFKAEKNCLILALTTCQQPNKCIWACGDYLLPQIFFHLENWLWCDSDNIVSIGISQNDVLNYGSVSKQTALKLSLTH